MSTSRSEKRLTADGGGGGIKRVLHLSFSDATLAELDGNDASNDQASVVNRAGG
ncbi:MAG TPA: hypothetical protein VHU84_10795 [Lacipirellulaceae bacterium]|nr:hypothetical protein [Lacipirellulaceae bacterium]